MKNKVIKVLRDLPHLILFVAFLILISLGSFLLWLPGASAREQISFIDAFFTATSAATATGLVVKEGIDFSFLGQIVILILIQIGVLVYVSFAALILSWLGGIMVVSSRATEEITNKKHIFDLPGLFKFIFLHTFIFEAIGFIIFFIHWYPAMPLGQAIFYSVFHAVSGFCGAGFTLFRGNMIAFQTDLVININLPILIILGSLGFTVLFDLKNWFLAWFKKEREKRIALELHTQIVLVTTAFITVGGSLLFYLFELNNLNHLSFQERLMVSGFQVIGRTAGFNTLDISSLNHPTLFLMMVLMFIGGAPNSAAGGIKVTTLFLIILMLFTLFRGKQEPVIWNTSISKETIWKAFAIVSICLIVIAGFFLILLQTEKAPFEWIAFEVFSAFGISGFSMGLTPILSETGKVLISLLMLFGRIGTLSVAIVLTRENQQARIRYPEEKVIVG